MNLQMVLHLIDINKVFNFFNRMVEEGNSLILLEHHIDVIKSYRLVD